MPKFAVYYIPPAESDLYRQGSEILGYDVRRGVMLPDDNPTRRRLPEFDASWVAQPQTYGFHVTAGYSLYFDIQSLPHIEREMEGVFNCFDSTASFWLMPAPVRVPVWHGDIVVLHYQPNAALLMLHTMLIARVNPLGAGSNISRSSAEPGHSRRRLVEAHRIQRYYTPYILDGWVPHFTLMMPYAGQQIDATRDALLSLFSPEPVCVTSICLLIREEEETHYRLYREFHLQDYPQPLMQTP